MSLSPGLVVVHSNQLESLAGTVTAWLARHPLRPLEQEVLLVQSNGMAEWVKMQLAQAHGVAAAMRVELPARFLWRAYRDVLGSSAVPPNSPFDKLPLTWRLMARLPELAARPGFEPVASFLGRAVEPSEASDPFAPSGPAVPSMSPEPAEPQGVAPLRHFQLAQRLADLFDQYQVYRSDWLEAWAQGLDVLLAGDGSTQPLGSDQAWQAALWRDLLAPLSPTQAQALRPRLHAQFLQRLASPERPATLPRRIVLFGTTQLPWPMLQALAALAGHCQVLVALPNPCRFHWADTVDGRELLRIQRRRHSLRGTTDPADLPPEALHTAGHPLLSAWGRQSRDFVRQWDAFDLTEQHRARLGFGQVDLFDEAPGDTALARLQAHIRDLVPLAESLAPHSGIWAEDDHSIVFQVAHSPQREVEILHDHLLHLLAQAPPTGAGSRPLAPRDIVVMVPDVETFAPAIRSVFGQFGRGHPRHIPWGLTDQSERGAQPMLVALEWLLRLPEARCTASELMQLLEVPALSRRYGIEPQALPTLQRWLQDSGVRWGLNAAQRSQLGLAPCGEANSWAFGLQRMLLGYAAGPLADGFSGIEPYEEIGGLDAAWVGQLAEFLHDLELWWQCLTEPAARPVHAPQAWAERFRSHLLPLFSAYTEEEKETLAALDAALEHWLHACDDAGFEEPIALDVAREAWLAALDEPRLSTRFKAGGVTFCTLLPMRAIPFEVVCLLGMNDADFPRQSRPSDFDLLALPGMGRPGDRSRREDDRQLMLDALLAARRALLVSWTGRSVRTNQEEPPSVLVAQLRDHLCALWGEAALAAHTTHHPLQPFSRRYFEAQGVAQAGVARPCALRTYAREWRAALDAPNPSEASSGISNGPPSGTSNVRPKPTEGGPVGDPVRGPAGDPAARQAASLTTAAPETTPQLVNLKALQTFLRNPVKAFFKHRLQVEFHPAHELGADEEPFEINGLDGWSLDDHLLRAVAQAVDGAPSPCPAPVWQGAMQACARRLARAGRLPLGGPGEALQRELELALQPTVLAWLEHRDAHPGAHPPIALDLQCPDAPGLRLQDTLGPLRAAPQAPSQRLEGEPAAAPMQPARPVLIVLQASKLASGSKGHGAKVKADKLLLPWLQVLAATAAGTPIDVIVVGADGWVHAPPPELGTEQARTQLMDLMRAAQEGMRGEAPWPTALETGVALLTPPKLKDATANEDAPERAESAMSAPSSDAPTDGPTDAPTAHGAPGAPGQSAAVLPQSRLLNHDRAASVFEGDDDAWNSRPEGADPHLARLYPDYEALSDAENFEAACVRLYAAFAQWLQGLQLQKLPEPVSEPHSEGEPA